MGTGPPQCSPWRRMAGGTVALFIYLLRLDQVKGAQPRCTFWAATDSHRVFAQAVSQWSCTLLKPDLAWASQGSSVPKIVLRPWARSKPPAARLGLG